MSKTAKNFAVMSEKKGLDETIEYFVAIGGLVGITTMGNRRVLFSMADRSFVVVREDMHKQHIDQREALGDIEDLRNYCLREGEALWDDITESAPEGQVGIRIDRAFGDFEDIPTSPIQ